jgi:hypothetical protein
MNSPRSQSPFDPPEHFNSPKLESRRRSGIAITLSIFAVAALSAAIVACVEEEPIAPDDLRPQWTVATLPDDSLDDHPAMLAIAREVPSFGGMYFNDQGELVVAMTDLSRQADAETRVRPILGNHQTKLGSVDHVTVRFVSRPVEYSFLELARYKTVLGRQVFGIPGVVTLDLKESLNRVRIGTAEAGAELEVRNLLTKLGIPEHAVTFLRVSPPRNTADSLQGPQPQGVIQGGWQIRSNSITACTLGFPAKRASNHASVFVTNSHCTALPWQPDTGSFRQPCFTTCLLIGSEVLDLEPHDCGITPCRHSDAALISAVVPIDLGRIARTTESSSCEECSPSIIINASNPTIQITGKYWWVFENETLHKVGRTTGWTYGDVEDTCTDVFTGGVKKRCSDRVDFQSRPGDSGSPVFFYNSSFGTAQLRGIQFGYDTFWSDSYMSNLHQIEKDLGSLVVYDPGPPQVTVNGPSELPPGLYCTWNAVVSAGIAPFTFQWSGILSGSTGAYQGGAPQTSGWLKVSVTDWDSRQAVDSMYVILQPGAPVPPLCDE